MKKIIISADSSCDLSKELTEKYDVKILSLPIILGTESYSDGVDVTAKDVFDYFNKTGELAKTAAAPDQFYRDWFKKCTDEGCEVIHFNISSKMSAAFNNCRMAAQDFDGCYNIDSKNLSTGIGQLVLEAAICRDKGMSAAEIVDYVNRMADKLNVSFVIDTLKYLYKGGRCSSLAALGANLLQLKPCIEVNDGAMSVGKKYRGKLASCIENYIKDRLEGRDDIDPHRIFITHSHCDPEVVQTAMNAVKKYQHFDEIYETTAGCTISVHCGPGTLGILYFNK
ncbi:MAG: DegV family protein [Ruminococcaceae bacterium]|nr:DegV family protein [Oscillospiraceae bacterium]